MNKASWVAVAVVLACAAWTEAATIKVDPRGGGDYLRLQQAINSARTGDVILVAPGTYDEQLVVDKEIQILGIDPLVCKIVYSGAESAIVFRNGSQNAQVMRLSVTAFNGHGILCEEGSRPTIRNNVLVGNGERGIYSYRAGLTVLNNTVADNGSSGMHLSGCEGTVANNIVVRNGGYGISIASNDAVFKHNDVWGNTSGTGYGYGSTDISMDPQFVNASEGDYRLQSSSPCLNAGWDSSVHADPDGSRNDIGAYGGPEAPSPGPMVMDLEIQPQAVPQGQSVQIRATGVVR